MLDLPLTSQRAACGNQSLAIVCTSVSELICESLLEFKTTRMQGDTTVGLTIPVTNGRTSYPTTGTVTRSMQVTVQPHGHLTCS